MRKSVQALGGVRASWLPVCAALLALSGCEKPQPPPTERPPDPQAARVAAVPDHAALRRAIDAPQDRARAVEDVTLDAADRRRAEIEAQTGD